MQDSVSHQTRSRAIPFDAGKLDPPPTRLIAR